METQNFNAFTTQFASWLEAEHLTYAFLVVDGLGQFTIEGTQVLRVLCVDLETGCKRLPKGYTPRKAEIILWEDVWVNKKDIVKSRIKALLGKSVRIPARLTQIERIDKPTADQFLENNHMNGSPAARYRYGLFLTAKRSNRYPQLFTDPTSEKVLVAVAAFAAPRTFTKNDMPYKSGELIRFASLRGTTVVGGLTKLTDHFGAQYHLDDVITYVDREWSDGSSFFRSGFTPSGQTEPHEFIIDKKTYIRRPLHRLDNKVLKELQGHSVQVFNAGSLKFTRHFEGKKPTTNPIQANKKALFRSEPPYDLILIAGPTASGKTKLAVRIAYELGGSIISLDSRQVFKKMDIGTGKDLAEYVLDQQAIPYYLIDILEAGQPYSVQHFKNDFRTIYKQLRTNKIPVIACGGSGLYIEAALEVLAEEHREVSASILFVALQPPVDLRNQRIEARLKKRLAEGMVAEVEQLLKDGLSEETLIRYGLEYKYLTLYLKGEIEFEEMYLRLFAEIRRFAKRQVTYLKRLERIGYPVRWL